MKQAENGIKMNKTNNPSRTASKLLKSETNVLVQAVEGN
jgi:hypothetical protein